MVAMNNCPIQLYNFWGRDIPLRCFRREAMASRFSINETNQNLWIPNKHLDENGNIKLGQNIDYVIVQARSQIKHSGLVNDNLFKPSVRLSEC